jgi:hypothetical protein
MLRADWLDGRSMSWGPEKGRGEPGLKRAVDCLVWSLLSDWCNFGRIPLAAWELGENPLCGRSPTDVKGQNKENIFIIRAPYVERSSRRV